MVIPRSMLVLDEYKLDSTPSLCFMAKKGG